MWYVGSYCHNMGILIRLHVFPEILTQFQLNICDKQRREIIRVRVYLLKLTALPLPPIPPSIGLNELS